MVLIKLVCYIAACCLSASPLYSLTLNAGAFVAQTLCKAVPSVDLEDFGMAESVTEVSLLFFPLLKGEMKVHVRPCALLQSQNWNSDENSKSDCLKLYLLFGTSV